MAACFLECVDHIEYAVAFTGSEVVNGNALVVSQLLDEGKASVKVLQSPDKWYGVTYREDKPGIVKALADKAADGLYPTPLWQ